MTSATVFVVDDDAGIRYSLTVLLETAGLHVESFVSAEDFLQDSRPDREGCLVLDVRMPGMSGSALQAELAQRGVTLPIIFLTAYADFSTGMAAMRQGAVDFLTKPVNGALLLERVQAALDRHSALRRANVARGLFELSLGRLTCREREVLALALSGMANRDIAARLEISLRTIEGHRSRIYLKTGAGSLLELAQQATCAGMALAEIAPAPTPS